jgi:transposase
LVPEGLWELFQRVLPPPPERPQGGGRRRSHGDREVLAAIVFVATSGCTWNQLPPGSGPSGVTAFRRLAEWSRARVRARLHRLVLDKLGGPGRAGLVTVRHRLRQCPSGQGGPLTGPDPTDRGRSGSECTSSWTATACLSPGDLRRQRPRQPGLPTARPRDTTHPLPPRTLPTPLGKAPRRHGIRLSSPAGMAATAGHHSPHSLSRSRELPTPWPASVGPVERTSPGSADADACTVATKARPIVSWPSP